jgi:hypothetical protein
MIFFIFDPFHSPSLGDGYIADETRVAFVDAGFKTILKQRTVSASKFVPPWPIVCNQAEYE